MIDGKDYFIGDRLTEADIRLYTTIVCLPLSLEFLSFEFDLPSQVRFDPVYYGHFKCNLKSIRHDYPNINRWMKNLYWNVPAFKNTTNFEHVSAFRLGEECVSTSCPQIKTHYYWSHTQINPTRIVPEGPHPNIESL
jgi:putative glutathione S-transferase